jgi:diketogulonate reductase-like aldo/keto reductase
VLFASTADWEDWASISLITIAKAHSVTESQVCMRWVLQRGAVLAAGTDNNATKAPGYACENIGIFDFELSSAEMITLNAFSNGTVVQ